jgi:hypothetical protein
LSKSCVGCHGRDEDATSSCVNQGGTPHPLENTSHLTTTAELALSSRIPATATVQKAASGPPGWTTMATGRGMAAILTVRATHHRLGRGPCQPLP